MGRRSYTEKARTLLGEMEISSPVPLRVTRDQVLPGQLRAIRGGLPA